MVSNHTVKAAASGPGRVGREAGRSGKPTRPALVHRLVRCLGACIERRRQRKRLAELSEHLLADIGCTRQEAAAEARKRFWQP